MGKGLYKVNPDGSYTCPECGTVYPKLRRFDAQNCCLEVKTGSGKAIYYNPLPYRPETRRRHRKTPLDIRRQEYLKAWRRVEHLADKYSLQKFLDTVFEKNNIYHWKGKRSPLQRLAWAFYQHNWEQVKHCAYQLAYDDMVRSQLRHYQERILDDFDDIARELLSRPEPEVIPPTPYEINLDDLGMN